MHEDDLLADGTLRITPESDLEAYALNQWGRVNLDWARISANGQSLPKMILDCSEYAHGLGIFVKIDILPTSEETQ